MATRALSFVAGAVVLLLVQSAAGQTSGVPHGGAACTTDWDCSLGGQCLEGKCACDAWFTGPSCVYLNLQRPAEFPGNQGLDYRSQNYYSWGGHCVQGDDGTYHGYFSFMCNHKTLSSWTTASSIVHATATSVEGPYKYDEMIIQPWAHNAIVQKDPLTGQYLVFHIGTAQVDPSQWSPCFNGTAADGDAAFDGSSADSAHSKGATSDSDSAPTTTITEIAHALGDGDGIYVSTAPTPDGPWTPYNNGSSLSFNLTGWWATGASNPTPFIFPNGTTLMMVAAFPCPAGWGNLAPPCIGMMRADHWSGPYTPLFDTPIVHPESEDPFMWRDPRGNYHLHTNVNTYHRRCAQGVPCGGHAWSNDTVTWSDQFIGAFGPVITSANGTMYTAAYVERPQIFQDPATGVPIAFFVGMGVSAYEDSMSWSQLFCTGNGSDPACGPTIAPPPVNVQVQHAPTGLCLVTNGTASFPCPGGWADSCPVFLGPCDGAGLASGWQLPSQWAAAGATFVLSSSILNGTSINVDCDYLVPHTVVKALQDTSPSSLAFLPASGGGGLGSITVAGSSSPAMCLNGGQGQAVPPCKAGEFYMPTGQIQLEECSSADASDVWRIVPLQ